MSSQDRLAEAIDWLNTSLGAARAAHAYVVVGAPRGDATELSMKLLETLYAPAAREELLRHPDILWVEPRTKSRLISIDQTREVQQRMSQTAFAGGWKTCVVVGADRMTVPAANAFLKTLEEPRGKAIFLLLTDQPEALLPTVVSRCQRVTLSSQPDDLPTEWRTRLMGVLTEGEDDDVLSGIARSTGLSSLLEEIKKSVADEVSESAGEDEPSEVVDARIGAKYREMRTTMLRLIMLWHRDILLTVCGAGKGNLFFGRYAEVIEKRAQNLDYAEALARVKMVERMKDLLERNVSDTTVFNLELGRTASGAGRRSGRAV